VRVATGAVFYVAVMAVIERERDMACRPGSSGGSAEGFFFWRLRRAVRGIEVWCSSRAFHPNILALFQRIKTELNFDQ
jgi:hypothetical protein